MLFSFSSKDTPLLSDLSLIVTSYLQSVAERRNALLLDLIRKRDGHVKSIKMLVFPSKYTPICVSLEVIMTIHKGHPLKLKDLPFLKSDDDDVTFGVVVSPEFLGAIPEEASQERRGLIHYGFGEWFPVTVKGNFNRQRPLILSCCLSCRDFCCM